MIVIKQEPTAKTRGKSKRNLLLGGFVTVVLLALTGAFFLPRDLPTRLKFYWLGLRADPPRLVLDMKYKHFQKLAAIREEVLATNAVHKYKDEFVPADLAMGDQREAVKIRLKGDRLIHYEHPREWSFRVRVKGPRTLLGMKNFSLHKPRARNYIYEWMFHRALKRENLIGLRYEFARLIFNGDDLGVYAIEEHFDKRLLEANGFREGPILRFDDDLAGSVWKTVIRPYDAADWLEPPRKEVLERAVASLQAFRAGNLPAHQVFDVEKLATFFALTDLLGMHHGALYKSMRFYHNPVTGLLEPIGFDGHFGTLAAPFVAAELGINPKAGWFYEVNGSWFRLWFNEPGTFDPVFFRAYAAELERLSYEKYLDDFLAEEGDALQQNLAIIYRDYAPLEDRIHTFGPALFTFDKQVFYQRQRYLRRVLQAAPLRAFKLADEPGKVGVVCENFGKFPLEIVALTLDGAPLQPKQRDRYVLATRAGQADPVTFTFVLPEPTPAASGALIVHYRIPGLSQIHEAEVLPWPHDTARSLSQTLPAGSEFKDQPFLDVDEPGRIITFQPGVWVLDEPLILPDGFRVRARGGVTLELRGDAKIVSYSPLEFHGEEEAPIRLFAADGRGQGLAVINAGTLSTFEYVHFEGLGAPKSAGWELTGAVTFYQSPVHLVSVTFAGARSEDALNIIRSKFEIRETHFLKTSFDAFDADFSDGRVSGSLFRDCGNDAIDISGGRVSVEDTELRTIGDKGVSAGERSEVRLRRVLIQNALVGMASKDQSHLSASQVTAAGCELDFAVYQKKSEFGPAHLEVVGFAKTGGQVSALVEQASSCSLEGREVEPNAAEVLKKIEQMALFRRYRKGGKS